MEDLRFKYARWINTEIGGLKRFPRRYVNVDFLMGLYKERCMGEKFDEELFKEVYKIILNKLREV